MYNADSHIYSIAPASPFLPTLRDAILDGTLTGGAPIGEDWIRLSKATIYVPTRRAARALRSLFVEHMAGQATLLPQIRPLGDFDEDATFFDDMATAEALDQKPVIGGLDRLFELQPLVEAWQQKLPDYFLARLEEKETIMLPASKADGFWLARELANVMDSVETEGGDWSALLAIKDNKDLAGWWEVTSEFLQIVQSYWPQKLEEMGGVSSVFMRLYNIDRERERIETAQTLVGPIIAAGSTGSIPATARLLKAIAERPEGSVVLPGLDRNMSDASFDALGMMQDDPAVLGHPQFGLRKLLASMGSTRDQVVELGTGKASLVARDALLSLALLPSDFTDQWHQSAQATEDNLTAGALEHVAWLEARNEREEAASIALMMRETIEAPDKTIALITPDRNLGRRVAIELRRFGIDADDSGGLPLPVTAQGSFLTLLAKVASGSGDPLAFVALAKHALLRCGKDARTIKEHISLLEIAFLRGSIGRPELGQLAPLFQERIYRDLEHEFKPQIPDDDKAIIKALAHAIDEATRPITDCFAQGLVPFNEAIIALTKSLENLARDDQSDLTHLYSGEAGEALASFLSDIIKVKTTLTIEPYELPQILDALIADRVVKPVSGGHPRVFIWGTLEARLQSLDHVILGGLNEGSWPSGPNVGPFLSRIMQQEMSLEPPERRIGLGAHDFQMAFGARHVTLSRAIRQEGAPSIPARWLQRLQTTIGPEATDHMKNKGQIWLDKVRRLDVRPSIHFAQRPEPKPPLDARPTHYSVTEAETLRRDPYAIYAKKVLKLRPLDALIRDPGPAERGTLIHAIMELLVTENIDARKPNALEQLTEKAEALFKEARLPRDIELVWWPRIEKLLPEIIRDEAENSLSHRYAEAKARPIQLKGTNVTLSGRADRIEQTGRLTHIIDYKTGPTPSKKQAQTLIAPQLPLEGFLMAEGAFEGIEKAMPEDLIYSRLKADGMVHREPLSRGRSAKEPVDIPELITKARDRFTEVLQHLAQEPNGFISRNIPFKEGDYAGDYDHLARYLEWSAGDEAGGNDGDLS